MSYLHWDGDVRPHTVAHELAEPASVILVHGLAVPAGLREHLADAVAAERGLLTDASRPPAVPPASGRLGGHHVAGGTVAAPAGAEGRATVGVLPGERSGAVPSATRTPAVPAHGRTGAAPVPTGRGAAAGHACQWAGAAGAGGGWVS